MSKQFDLFLDPAPDLITDPRDRAREWDRDRGRSQERKHHSSSAPDRKQRYYSCDRYGNREHFHSRSPGPSRSTSPGDPQEPNRFKTVPIYSFMMSFSFGKPLRFCIYIFVCMSVCLQIYKFSSQHLPLVFILCFIIFYSAGC